MKNTQKLTTAMIFEPKALRMDRLALDEVILIDIRRRASFAKFHIQGSLNIPVNTASMSSEDGGIAIRRLKEIALNEPKPLALICFSANHAKKLCYEIAKALNEANLKVPVELESDSTPSAPMTSPPPVSLASLV